MAAERRGAAACQRPQDGPFLRGYEEHRCRFFFEADDGTYSWYEDLNRNGSLDNGEYESAEYDLGDTIEIAGHTLSSTTLTFGNKGSTRESGSITLRNVLNNVSQVRIFGGIGNVTVD